LGGNAKLSTQAAIAPSMRQQRRAASRSSSSSSSTSGPSQDAPLQDLEAHVAQEDVAAVQAGVAQRHLAHHQPPAVALDVQQPRRVRLRPDLREAGVDAAVQDHEGGEERQEGRRLVALRLPVLHRVAAKVVVQLDGLVGGGARLVRRRL